MASRCLCAFGWEMDCGQAKLAGVQSQFTQRRSHHVRRGGHQVGSSPVWVWVRARRSRIHRISVRSSSHRLILKILFTASRLGSVLAQSNAVRMTLSRFVPIKPKASKTKMTPRPASARRASVSGACHSSAISKTPMDKASSIASRRPFSVSSGDLFDASMSARLQ